LARTGAVKSYIGLLLFLGSEAAGHTLGGGSLDEAYGKRQDASAMTSLAYR
jgi:hypothetical protein